jgi:hypothetical protein
MKPRVCGGGQLKRPRPKTLISLKALIASSGIKALMALGGGRGRPPRLFGYDWGGNQGVGEGNGRGYGEKGLQIVTIVNGFMMKYKRKSLGVLL